MIRKVDPRFNLVATFASRETRSPSRVSLLRRRAGDVREVEAAKDRSPCGGGAGSQQSVHRARHAGVTLNVGLLAREELDAAHHRTGSRRPSGSRPRRCVARHIRHQGRHAPADLLPVPRAIHGWCGDSAADEIHLVLHEQRRDSSIGRMRTPPSVLRRRPRESAACSIHALRGQSAAWIPGRDARDAEGRQ